MSTRTITNSNLSFPLDKRSILIGYRGSIAHGMYRPNTEPNSTDDKDIMGVFTAPDEYYFGLLKIETVDWNENKEGTLYDYVFYETKKYINMLIGSNPNVLSLLWLHDSYYVKITPEGQLLIDNRDLFATKAIYRAFTGYAYGQLHKMEHYTFQGYMGEKRKKLVEKYGFDCKNASHLIRLLRMGIEFLLTGELNVLRHDAQQLLEIKNGAWTLEQVKNEATRLFIRAEEALLKSTLPNKPNFKQVNQLCMDITMRTGNGI